MFSASKNILVLSAHSLSLDRRIISQINALAEEGHKVTLLSLPVYDDCSNLIDHRVKKIMPFITKSIERHSQSLKQYIRKYLPELILAPLRLYRAKRFFTNYFLQRVSDERYDIIHAHDLTTIPAAIAIKNKSSPNSKIIYDAHEIYPHQFENKIETSFWLALEKKLMKFVDVIITVNESCKLYFEENFQNCPPTHVIYNSYSLDIKEDTTSDYINVKQYFTNKELPIFIFQGGLSAGRNLENMVAGFVELKEVANLLIVGRGDILPTLQKTATKPNIFFMDWVAQDKLPAILKQVNFGIIPYIADGKLNNLYCTPNKLFEFINFRIPILANNLPEIRRIIEEFEIGLTADLSNIDLIKEAVQKMVTKIFSSTNFVNADFTLGWEAQKKVLLQIYN